MSASDLHCHIFPEHDYVDPERGFSARLGDCLDVLRLVRKRAEKVDAGAVVFGGDLFHKMGIINVEVFNRTFNAVRDLAKDFDVYLLDGNHDHASRDGSIHSLQPFSAIPRVFVPGEAAVTLKAHGESVDVAFFPYSDNRERLLAGVKKYSGRPLAFMHHGFEGARVGSVLEYVVKEPLSPRQVGKHFGMVFSGHYHRMQFVHDNVMYIGSSLEHTRSDATSEEKGFLVIDTDTPRDPQFVPVKKPKFVVSNSVGLFTGSHEELKGNFVDFQLDKNEDPREVEPLLKKAGVRGIKFLPYAPPRTFSKSDKRVDVKAGMGLEAVILEGVRRRHGKLNRKKLQRLMMDVLKEATLQR